MKNTSTKILFFGNERLVSGLKHTDTPVLRGLLDRGYDVRAVISHHGDSRSRTQRDLEVAQVAAEHNIPVHLPNRPTDIMEEIAAYDADIAVLVAYGRIIPQRVIDLFPKGVINIHPSLLPQYRGPTPIESSILDGIQKTGVSIMQLTAGMDSGPVYGQADLSLTGTETKFDIYTSLSRMGAELLFDLLPKIIDGSIAPVEQDDTQATYCQLLTKDSGKLQFDTLSATEAERQIRAYLGFPKSKATVFGHDIIVTKAHVSQTQKTHLDLKCRDGLYLSVDELIAPSGRQMNADNFLRGYAAKPTSL
jgi:methionyl-tRNA formyltransferase